MKSSIFGSGFLSSSVSDGLCVGVGMYVCMLASCSIVYVDYCGMF